MQKHTVRPASAIHIRICLLAIIARNQALAGSGLTTQTCDVVEIKREGTDLRSETGDQGAVVTGGGLQTNRVCRIDVNQISVGRPAKWPRGKRIACRLIGSR